MTRFHPWVFSGALQERPNDLQDGDLVRVFSNSGDCLATGHFYGGTIAVRVLTFCERTIDSEFWSEKLTDAVHLRATLGLLDSQDTTAFRLVNGEGDGLPGLIIDYYNGCAVVQCHTLGMYKARQEIAAALQVALGARLHAVFDKSHDVLRIEGEGVESGYLLGSAPELPFPILECGQRFLVDWEHGQKTGFFLDQRENRQVLRRWATGRRVLNTFCYTGGFSVAALAGGAEHVESVDSSKRAIELAVRNVAANGFDNRHIATEADCIQLLEERKGDFDCIVLDPPAFAKHIKQAPQALRGYRRINEAALRMLPRGGLLFTFSCSQVVSKEQFKTVLFQSGVNTRRELRIVAQLGQPGDHPMSLYHPEAEYLKGFVLLVS